MIDYEARFDTVEEMQAQLDKMKDDIAHMDAKVSEYEHMISVIKAQDDEPKFERARKFEDYFMILFENGKARADTSCEYYDELDNARFINNNYFKTDERAREVADKINFLLRLERLHDLYCPKYIPNWNDDKEEKWYVFFDNIKGFYDVNSVKWAQDETIVYFSSEEIAQKVCYILNKERRKQ